MPTQADPSAFSHLPSSRKEAKAIGETRYFTGEPCPCGQVAPRHVTNWTCIECTRADARKWQKENVEENRKRSRDYAKKYPDRVKAANKIRYAENRDKEHERSLARYKANPAYARENSKRWYAANKERAKAMFDAWRRANPDKVTATHHRRRARKAAAAIEPVSAPDIAKLKARQKCCPDCGVRFSKKIVATLDHIVSLARGGAHAIRNLELRCKPCNSRKHTRDPIEHAQMLGRLL